MNRLAVLVRKHLPLEANIYRGPKKKKDAELKLQSTDIVNIYKNESDPEPVNLKEYPLYVQEIGRQYCPSSAELRYGAELGINYLTPTKPLYKSFIRGIKRGRVKDLREFKQLETIPIHKSEKFDYFHRLAIYDMFRKTKEEIQADEKKQREQMLKEQEQMEKGD